jgi:hypothetical protein
LEFLLVIERKTVMYCMKKLTILLVVGMERLLSIPAHQFTHHLIRFVRDKRYRAKWVNIPSRTDTTAFSHPPCPLAKAVKSYNQTDPSRVGNHKHQFPSSTNSKRPSRVHFKPLKSRISSHHPRFNKSFNRKTRRQRCQHAVAPKHHPLVKCYLI